MNGLTHVTIASPLVYAKSARLYSFLRSHRTSCMLLKSGLLKAQLCPLNVQVYLGPAPDHIHAATTAVVTTRTVRLYFLCMAWLACTSCLFPFSDLQSWPAPAWLACTSSLVSIPDLQCWLACAGGDWKNFNTSQRQRRADMLCLYGTSKRLVPRSKGYAVTGSLDNSVHALFALQVSEVVRHI